MQGRSRKKRFFLNCLLLFLIVLAIAWPLQLILQKNGLLTDRLREAIGVCAAAVFYGAVGVYLIVLLIRNGWFSRRGAALKAAAKRVKAAANRLTAKKASRTTAAPAVYSPQQKPSMLPNVAFVIAFTRSLLIRNYICCSLMIGGDYTNLFPLYHIPAPILLIALIHISLVTAGMSAFFYDKGTGIILLNSIISGMIAAFLFSGTMFFSSLLLDLSGWSGFSYVMYLLFLSPAVTVGANIFTTLQIVFYKWVIRKSNLHL